VKKEEKKKEALASSESMVLGISMIYLTKSMIL
jgi:hypothetical protein